MDALNGALTSVGVVVDMSAFDSDKEYDDMEKCTPYIGATPEQLFKYASEANELTAFGAQYMLYKLLKSGRLA